jgi:uncharacterized membrane protein (UPF0127 family)
MNATALTIHRADSFMSRLLGLLARRALQANEALYLAPCASVHTFFMRYSIDVAFVSREGRVLRLVSHLKPFRAASCWRAHGAVEFAAGEATRLGIVEGSLLAVGSAAGESE